MTKEDQLLNRSDIIRMALEAGMPIDDDCFRFQATQERVTRFAALVAATAVEREREALEKIDWTVLLRQGALVTWGDAETLADRVIAAIREHSANAGARGETSSRGQA